MTPTGRRKQAAAVGMPVSELTTTDPPVSSMAVTRMLVMRPNVVKTRCAYVPTRNQDHILIGAKSLCTNHSEHGSPRGRCGRWVFFSLIQWQESHTTGSGLWHRRHTVSST